MNIIVCSKVVDNIMNSNILVNNPVNEVFKSELILNPPDIFAIETALRLQKKGKVTLLSMGKLQTENVLKKTFAYGIDEIILLSDILFAGADSFATSYILSRYILKQDKFHLIICGTNSIDGSTGHIVPSLGEQLNIPHVTNVTKIDEVNEEYIYCTRRITQGIQTLKVKLPAIISVEESICEPRQPTIQSMADSLHKRVIHRNARSLGLENNKDAILSYTKVLQIDIQPSNHDKQFIEGELQGKAIKFLEIMENILLEEGDYKNDRGEISQ